jgi:hypothetical protein
MDKTIEASLPALETSHDRVEETRPFVGPDHIISGQTERTGVASPFGVSAASFFEIPKTMVDEMRKVVEKTEGVIDEMLDFVNPPSGYFGPEQDGAADLICPQTDSNTKPFLPSKDQCSPAETNEDVELVYFGPKDGADLLPIHDGCSPGAAVSTDCNDSCVSRASF